MFQYESVIEKFFKQNDVNVLQYLGNAYFLAGQFKKARTVFLKVS